jgi:hypothetical protein
MGMYKGTFPKRWLNAIAVIGILTALAIIGWQVTILHFSENVPVPNGSFNRLFG